MSVDTTQYFDELFQGATVMGILRGLPLQRTHELCDLLWATGITAVEVPIQSPESREVAAAVIRRARPMGLPVGVGTVLTNSDVDIAIDVGAAFAVSPGFMPQISTYARDRDLALLPGVATASEIQAALSLGHVWLKAFPAAQLGPDWITAQLGPFPSVNFVATGGVDGINATAFLAAGARAVAVGSAIADNAHRRSLAALVEAGR